MGIRDTIKKIIRRDRNNNPPSSSGNTNLQSREPNFQPIPTGPYTPAPTNPQGEVTRGGGSSRSGGSSGGGGSSNKNMTPIPNQSYASSSDLGGEKPSVSESVLKGQRTAEALRQSRLETKRQETRDIVVRRSGGVEIGNRRYVGDTNVPGTGMTANEYRRYIRQQAIDEGLVNKEDIGRVEFYIKRSSEPSKNQSIASDSDLGIVSQEKYKNIKFDKEDLYFPGDKFVKSSGDIYGQGTGVLEQLTPKEIKERESANIKGSGLYLSSIVAPYAILNEEIEVKSNEELKELSELYSKTNPLTTKIGDRLPATEELIRRIRQTKEDYSGGPVVSISSLLRNVPSDSKVNILGFKVNPRTAERGLQFGLAATKAESEVLAFQLGGALVGGTSLGGRAVMGTVNQLNVLKGASIASGITIGGSIGVLSGAEVYRKTGDTGSGISAGLGTIFGFGSALKFKEIVEGASNIKLFSPTKIGKRGQVSLFGSQSEYADKVVEVEINGVKTKILKSELKKLKLADLEKSLSKSSTKETKLFIERQIKNINLNKELTQAEKDIRIRNLKLFVAKSKGVIDITPEGQVLKVVKIDKIPEVNIFQSSSNKNLGGFTGMSVQSKYGGTGQYERSDFFATNIPNTNQKNRLTQITNNINLLETSPSQKLDTKQESNLSSNLKINLLSKQSPRQSNILRPETKQDSKQNNILRSETVQVSKSKQKLDLLTRSISKLTPRTTTTKTSIPKIPKIKIPTPQTSKGKSVAKQKVEDIFKAFGRVKGQDIELGEFKTQVGAERKLKTFLKTTLGASGKVKRGEEELEFSELGLFGGGEFRQSKVSPFRVVQKRERRLSTGQETSQIQFFKKQKGTKTRFL